MATLKLDIDSTFDVDVTVRESDKYSQLAFVKFEKNFHPEGIHACNELFLTPTQLDLLGRFFIRQADEMQSIQSLRKKTEISQG